MSNDNTNTNNHADGDKAISTKHPLISYEVTNKYSKIKYKPNQIPILLALIKQVSDFIKNNHVTKDNNLNLDLSAYQALHKNQDAKADYDFKNLMETVLTRLMQIHVIETYPDGSTTTFPLIDGFTYNYGKKEVDLHINQTISKATILKHLQSKNLTETIKKSIDEKTS